MVMQNNVQKYKTNIGQNTGTLNVSTNVHRKAKIVLYVTAIQNLNSGKRLMNGRNSSDALVGKAGPLSSSPEIYQKYTYYNDIWKICIEE